MEDIETAVSEASNGSLSARAAQRRKTLSEERSSIIEVPGYEGILAVEYRALSYSEARKVVARHERVKDEATRDLYIAADHLIRASVNSYELVDGDVEKRRELGHGWSLSLARELGIEVDETMTVRQAVLACFPRDTLLGAHYADYSGWLNNIEQEIDEEQRKDFHKTG